jgi:uncharacterized protein YhaN
VRDLPDGLTIVCGPNGSGKSTVFAFLARGLFGGPAAGTAIHRSPRGAGHIWCAGPGGDITIVQSDDPGAAPVARRADGRDVAAADLDACFGGADCRLIGSLLAFDAQALRTPIDGLISAMRRQSNAPAARALVDRIRRALDSIRDRAGRPDDTAHDASALPDDVQDALTRARRAAAEWSQLLCVQARLRREAASLAGEIEALKAEHARHELLVDLAPDWRALTRAREELARLEAPAELPAAIEERLAVALAVARTGPAHESSHADPANPEGPPPAQELIAWQRRLTEVVDAVRTRESELNTTKRRLAELEAERDAIQSTVGPEPPALARIDDSLRLIQRVRTGLAAIEEEDAEIRRLQERIAECGGAVRELEATPIRQPSRIILHGGWMGALAGTSALALRPPAGHVFEAGALVVCSALGVAGTLIQRARGTAFVAATLDRRARLAALQTELQDACRQLGTHQEQASRRRFDVGVDSTRLGLRAHPSPLQLQVLSKDLLDRRERRQAWEAAQSGLVHLQSVRDEFRARERANEAAVREARARQQEAVGEWQHWKARTGLANRTEADPAETPDAIAQLCSEAGVADESALRARIAGRRRYLDLQQAIAESERRLHERLPAGDAGAAVLELLAAGAAGPEPAPHGPGTLADREHARDRARRQLEEIDRRIDTVAADAAALPRLEAELATAANDAQDAAADRQTLTAAAARLAAACTRAERLCQPPVVQSTSRRLLAITGRYELQLAPGAHGTASIVDARGARKSLEQLSRATLEQLQFSVRLGIADEVSRCGVSLPLLIDDAIDDGDSVRRHSLAEQVVDISRGRQVLVFTSRPETADLLRRLDPTAHTIVMQEL